MATQSHRLQYPPTLMVVIASIASAIVVTACGPDDEAPVTRAAVTAPVERQRPAVSPDLGEVRGIEPIKSGAKATGAGAAIGGVAGNQVGKHRSVKTAGEQH